MLSGAIGIVNSDRGLIPLKLSAKDSVPLQMVWLTIPMIFFSSLYALMFLLLQSVGVWWRVAQLLGCFFLPYFIAHEMFQLGRAIATKRQQKSKVVDEEIL